ncbi:hypothetical protein [Roseivirga sp.]|uniref:hypothetical protein n=1 Tax=Roseivirga sp. TaxID=1964215 RepID=UPI003B8D7A9F
MKNSQLLNVLLTSLIIVAIFSCSNDDALPVNEEEFITTVTVKFTNTEDANDVVIASFKDIDGPGGDVAVITNPILSQNTVYNTSITFLNENKSPAENITQKVAQQDENHIVFYISAEELDFVVVYDDQDANGQVVGLKGTAYAGANSTGELTVTLVEGPNKDNLTGIPTPELSGGNRVIEFEFAVTIQ